MADPVSDVNNKIISSLKGFASFDTGKATTIGAIILGIVLIGAIVYFLVIYPKKKSFKKKVTAFEIVGTTFVPTIKDDAKVVKIGTSGFEILYLKKSKTFRVSYGGRVGKDTYYFFIMPDGYW